MIKMTTDLINVTPAKNYPEPPKHSETAYRSAARVTNAIIGESWHMDGLTVLESAALSNHERLELSAREIQLINALMPCFSDLAARYCQALLACFPMPVSKDDDAETIKKMHLMRAHNFLAVAKQYPEWALNTVCSAMREGRMLKNPSFAPTTAEFGKALHELVEPVIAEKRKLYRVLNAKTIPEYTTPQSRERVINLFADLKQHLSSNARPLTGEVSTPS